MRLYLSSFKMGNQPERLVALAGSGKRVALVLNALDDNRDNRAKWLMSQTEALNQLGFVVDELDLRTCFGKPEELRGFLKEKDMIWINGGNTFLLRRAMRQRGFDSIIHELLRVD